jgi:hypothetical protein
MGSLFGGKPDTSKQEELQEKQLKMQQAQATKLAEKERKERNIAGARDRALLGSKKRQTLYGSFLGNPGEDS